ncbi:unnamed protein product [Brachionus calyciflorus]|uniref:Uncharacterized protein n=1 Tax=Brachionus calyciflorus TaxID=104777 RepID=A0A814NDW3_9BILA|nr:unnamed protein product [Brachionus calyciflorus]
MKQRNFLLCNLPVSIVDRDEFRNLLKDAIPGYSVPCRQTFTKNLIPQKSVMVKSSIAHELSGVNSFSLTCDAWTSNSNLSYLGVTCHYLNKDFILTSRLLSLKYLEEDHKSEYLFEVLKEIINEWYLDGKVFKIVSDSGSNMKGAITRFNDKFVPCVAHRINLCVNDIMSEKGVKTIFNNLGEEEIFVKLFDDSGSLKQHKIDLLMKNEIEKSNNYKKSFLNVVNKSKELVGSIKHSIQLTENLRKKQEILKLENKRKLVQDLRARWNCTYDDGIDTFQP